MTHETFVAQLCCATKVARVSYLVAESAVVSKHLVSYAVRSILTCPDTSFISSGLFLLCTFAIASTNNVALIKHRRLYHLMPCLLRVLLQLHMAWLQLRSKVARSATMPNVAATKRATNTASSDTDDDVLVLSLIHI